MLNLLTSEQQKLLYLLWSSNQYLDSTEINIQGGKNNKRLTKYKIHHQN